MNRTSDNSAKLIDAVLSLRTKSEARAFLRDLMTENEIAEFSNRYRTACMLVSEVPYSEIQSSTGFSSTTVARVSKWLKNGTGGYNTVISRLHHAPVSSERGLR